jgi:hypothetical protein
MQVTKLLGFPIFYKATLVTWNAAKCIRIAVLDPGSVLDDHIIRTFFVIPIFPTRLFWTLMQVTKLLVVCYFK